MRIILIRRIASAYWRFPGFSVWILRVINAEGETPSRGGRGMDAAESDFTDELGLEFHRADTVDLAIDIVVAVAQADVLDLGADLDHQGRAFDLEVFDDRDGVAVLQDVAYRVFLHGFIAGCFGLAIGGPFMGAFRADQLGAVFVGVFGIAFRAGWQSAH